MFDNITSINLDLQPKFDHLFLLKDRNDLKLV